MSTKRTSRPARPVQPNSPEKRIEHVLRTYWKKHPNQCIDTATVASFLVGYDRDAPTSLMRSQHAWREFDRSEHEKGSLLLYLSDGRIGSLPGPTAMAGRVRDLFSAWPPQTRDDWALVTLLIFLRHFPAHHEYESIIPWVARELVALSKSKPVRWVKAERPANNIVWLGHLQDDEQDDEEEPSKRIELRFHRWADRDDGFWVAWYGLREICTSASMGERGSDLDELKQCVEHHFLKRITDDLVELLKQKITAVAIWAKETRTDIGKVTVAQALDAIATHQFKTALLPQGTVVYKFADGWTVQDLRTAPELKAEGQTMQHCVGGYAERVDDGASRIYSLRDPSGSPHVTLEWSPDAEKFGGGRYAAPGDPDWDEFTALSPQEFLRSKYHLAGYFPQIYGKQNEKPAAKYVPRVREFIDQVFNGDVKALMSLGVPLVDLDLRRKDLRGLDFEGRADDGELKVRGLDFTGSDMRGCVFDQNTVEDCVFDLCDLRDAQFTKASIHDCTFVGADMRLARFDFARFSGKRTTFRGANVDKASFHMDRYGGTAIIEKLLSEASGSPYYSTTFKRENQPREVYIDEERDDPHDEDDAQP